MKRIFLLLSFVLLFLGLVVFRGFQSRHLADESGLEKSLPVEVTRLEPRLFRETFHFVGTLEPEESAAVVAKLPGRTVLSVAVDIGDVVREGQVLALLDDTLLSAGLAQAEAAVAAASAGLRQARAQEETLRLDHERFRSLLEEEVVSRQSYDHVKGQHEAATAVREAAEKALLQAREAKGELVTQMGYHRLAAPVDGVVAARLIDPGDSSNVVSPAFVINRQDRVKVKGALPERSFLRVKQGQEVTLTIDALNGETFQGTVSRLSPALDGATRTGDVEVLLESGGRLRPGLFARVAIAVGERRGKALPREALFRLEGTGERICYVVDGDGRARSRIVKTGFEEGNWIEITGGLSEEDVVVLTRSGSLRDGVLLEVSRE